MDYILYMFYIIYNIYIWIYGYSPSFSFRSLPYVLYEYTLGIPHISFTLLLTVLRFFGLGLGCVLCVMLRYATLCYATVPTYLRMKVSSSSPNPPPPFPFPFHTILIENPSGYINKSTVNLSLPYSHHYYPSSFLPCSYLTSHLSLSNP